MFFLFHDTTTTEIYTLSLHDALPISTQTGRHLPPAVPAALRQRRAGRSIERVRGTHADSEAAMRILKIGGKRSEEHTSELQSRPHLVCRLLLEKKKKNKQQNDQTYKT